MQILKPASFLADAFRGMCVLRHEITAEAVEKAKAAPPDSYEKLTLRQDTQSLLESTQWMNVIKSYQDKEENLSKGVPGVITVKNLQVPLSSIPDYSNLNADLQGTATVSGVLDDSPQRLREHHGVPEFHLVAISPSSQNPQKMAKSEYTAAEGYDGFHFVGSAYRTQLEDHPTIQKETVVRMDSSMLINTTRPFPG